MVSPNLVASFIVFILVGFFTYAGSDPLISESKLVRFATFLVLFFNAVYYLYYELYSELDKSMCDALEKSTKYEWLLRVLGQCVLYSLWFLLEYGWIWFQIGLLALYIIYIFWSILTWEIHPKKYLAYIDFSGLLLSAFFLFINVQNILSVPDHEFLVGVLAMGYLIVSILGICIAKFNPFNLNLWRNL